MEELKGTARGKLSIRASDGNEVRDIGLYSPRRRVGLYSQNNRN